jgi:protein TonB
MSRQRPPWDQAGPPLLLEAGTHREASFQGPGRTGHSGDEERRTLILVCASIAVHLVLGLLAALAISPAPAMEDTPPLVEMVFDAAPAPPAQALAPGADTLAEPPKEVQDTPVEVPPSPPLAAQPVEPAPLPPAELPPATPAPAQAPSRVEPQPPPAAPPPAVAPLPGPPLPEQAKPAQPAQLPVQAPPMPPPARTSKPAVPLRPSPARLAPAPSASHLSPPSPSFAPPPLAVSPSGPAHPSDVQPRAILPAVGPAPASSVVSGAWRSALASWVQSRKRYPDEARRQMTEGQVSVRFTIGRDGQVLDAQVVRGSGSDLLDQAALSMFRGGRAPSFPADMAQQQVTTTASIRYRLEE